MTREQAIEALRKLQVCEDQEMAHIRADGVLRVLLRVLGHGDVVDEFDKVKKWYA
jgi:hypothetical protein